MQTWTTKQDANLISKVMTYYGLITLDIVAE
jgi:hypothetical protein